MACCIVSLFIPFCSDEAICLFWYHKDKLNFAKLYMKKKEWDFFFFFFLRESFNLWCLLLMIDFYYQIKTLISFWCRQSLNSRSLIQPLETLPVKLTGTHKKE